MRYNLSDIYVSSFSFNKKMWVGLLNLKIENEKEIFLSQVSFSFQKNWHFNDFTFPLNSSSSERKFIKESFIEKSKPIFDELYHKYILPREQNPFVPNIIDFKLERSDLENEKFLFSFKLSQHQPLFSLEVFNKDNLLYYKFSCSKKFYDNHLTSLFFEFFLFKKIEPKILELNELRFFFITKSFFHKEEPNFSFFL